MRRLAGFHLLRVVESGPVNTIPHPVLHSPMKPGAGCPIRVIHDFEHGNEKVRKPIFSGWDSERLGFRFQPVWLFPEDIANLARAASFICFSDAIRKGMGLA